MRRMNSTTIFVSMSDSLGRCARLTLSDEPEKYRDAPVSLQLVGRRYDDEKISCPTSTCFRHADKLADHRGS